MAQNLDSIKRTYASLSQDDVENLIVNYEKLIRDAESFSKHSRIILSTRYGLTSEHCEPLALVDQLENYHLPRVGLQLLGELLFRVNPMGDVDGLLFDFERRRLLYGFNILELRELVTRWSSL